MHLCFDGSEPPASVHVGDFDVHHRSDSSVTKHSDLDVNLIGDTVVKKPDGGGTFDLPFIVRAVLIPPRQIQTIHARPDSPPAGMDSTSRLRPPPRAPPL